MATKSPSTKKEFDALSPEEKNDVITLTVKALDSKELVEDSDAHKRLIEKVKWFDDDSQDKIGNITWQKNRRDILVEIDRFIETEGMMPSVLEISNAVKLSRNTVYKHLQELKEGKHLKEEMMIFKAQRGRFYAEIYKAAKTGSLSAIKLANEMMDKVTEHQEETLSDEESQTKLKQLLKLIPMDKLDEANEIIQPIDYGINGNEQEVKLKSVQL